MPAAVRRPVKRRAPLHQIARVPPTGPKGSERRRIEMLERPIEFVVREQPALIRRVPANDREGMHAGMEPRKVNLVDHEARRRRAFVSQLSVGMKPIAESVFATRLVTHRGKAFEDMMAHMNAADGNVKSLEWRIREIQAQVDGLTKNGKDPRLLSERKAMLARLVDAHKELNGIILERKKEYDDFVKPIKEQYRGLHRLPPEVSNDIDVEAKRILEHLHEETSKLVTAQGIQSVSVLKKQKTTWPKRWGDQPKWYGFRAREV